MSTPDESELAAREAERAAQVAYLIATEDPAAVDRAARADADPAPRRGFVPHTFAESELAAREAERTALLEDFRRWATERGRRPSGGPLIRRRGGGLSADRE